jgi:hypothetical protein
LEKKMKLKLVQKGYENMTGYLGMTLFQDGLSVNDVPLREARNLGMAIKVEYEDGSDPNPAQNLLNSMHNKAGEVVAPLGDSETKSPVSDKEVDAGGADKVVEAAKPAGEHTQESLEAVADKDGIKGLRAIADKFEVKGTSIAELIREILEAQAK